MIDGCVDVDVVSTGGWTSDWAPYAGHFYTGPRTINIGPWGAFPTLTQPEIVINCTACGSSTGGSPPTAGAPTWGYTGTERRPAIDVGVDKGSGATPG